MIVRCWDITAQKPYRTIAHLKTYWFFFCRSYCKCNPSIGNLQLLCRAFTPPREHGLLENHVSSGVIYWFHSCGKRHQTLGVFLIFGQYLQAGWNGALAFFTTQCVWLQLLELEGGTESCGISGSRLKEFKLTVSWADMVVMVYRTGLPSGQLCMGSNRVKQHISSPFAFQG